MLEQVRCAGWVDLDGQAAVVTVGFVRGEGNGRHDGDVWDV